MHKVMYIKWNDYDENRRTTKGGTFRLSISGSTLTYEIVNGSAIDTDELIGFLWHWSDLNDVRKLASSLTRKGPWRVESHQGMSGAIDYWVEFLDNFGIVRETNAIIHNSMNSKSNIKIECWIKDLYDMLWYFKNHDIFKSSFEDSGTFGFKDITDQIMSRREFFNSHSFGPYEGFSEDSSNDEDQYVEFDENKLYE